MGMMNKIRENTKYVLYLLVFSFGILWMLQDTGAFDNIGSVAGRDILSVDGDGISYEEFQQILEGQVQQRQQQTGTSLSQSGMDNLREFVYNQLVDGMLIEHEMDRLGISVPDQELVQLVTGENPHPTIVNIFNDGQGNLDRALLESYIDNPDATEFWTSIEAQIRDSRRREKLQKVMEATVQVTDQDVQQEYERTNKSVDAQYVALRYASIPDDSISVSDNDLRNYYNENQEEFKRNKAYTMKYVSLSKDPTPADTLLILNELEQLKTTFAEAEDDSVFLQRYASERLYASTFFRADDLDEEVANAVFANTEPGTIIGPLVVGNEARLLKIQEVTDAGEPVIRARHILFRATEGNAEQEADALTEAREVLGRIRNGEDFVTLARLFSDDNSNAASGGDLGWFGRGAMVEPFQDAAFATSVGNVAGPVKTQFGYHLIQVTDRSDVEVRLADYVQSIEASVNTLTDISERLDDLQYFASESGDFDGEAGRLDLTVRSVQVEEGQTFIPDLGNSRSLINFMSGSSEGALSEVIELDNVYVVAQLSEVIPEGYRPFEEVQAELEPRVRIEKKKAIQQDRLAAASAGQSDLTAIAQGLGTAVRTASGVTATPASLTDLGNDPTFRGTVLAMEQDAISNVVTGNTAAYIVKVTAVNDPAPITDAEKERIRGQILQRLRTQVTSSWLASLRDKADIVDNRRLFQQ